jgi:hypothetical protein
MSTAPGGGLSTAPGGGLSTAPGGGLSTAPGGGLWTGSCPEPYRSNQPPPAVLVEYLANHGMIRVVEQMAAAGHPEARAYLNRAT